MPTRVATAAQRYRRSLAAGIGALGRDQIAGAAVESAFIVPLLTLSLLGIVEFSQALWTLNALHYSVEEAARCASINTTKCGTATQIETFAAQQSGISFSPSVFSASTASCGNQVSANYKMPLNIPFVTSSLALTAQSCYPI